MDTSLMTFFHATTSCRGEKILADGIISRWAEPSVKWTQPTSPGWVYLSDHLDHAVHWGNKVSVMNEEEEMFYIFKVMIPLSTCFPDVDDLLCETQMSVTEAASVDVLSGLEICHSCRIDTDLIVSRDVTEFCQLPVNLPNNHAHPMRDVVSNLIAYIEPHEHIIMERYRRMIKWISL